MSAVVHSIKGHPRLRISRIVQLLVTRQRLAALDDLRTHLPLDDPDRHALDTVDTAYGRMEIQTPDPAIVTEHRRAALLHAIRAEDGRWKAGRATRLYMRLGYGVVGKHRAAGDLKALRAAGHLIQHDTDGVRYFTLDGASRV
ncbi:hypothetical protein ACFZB5_13925 [Streptomyces nodosus]|uniref:hypothetical protein n=1 Tax=Streptomyces nodosus TaxID=40318 RepID=UPI0036E60936